MKITKSQFRRWVTGRTKQYVSLITDLDPNYVKVSFYNNFNQYPRYLQYALALCCKDDSHISYRTDYLDKWDVDWKAIDNMIIHEVCHLNHDIVHDNGHTNAFYTDYKHWSGDDYISRYIDDDNVDYEYKGKRYTCMIKNLPFLIKGDINGIMIYDNEVIKP
jgi:hypothetical protein